MRQPEEVECNNMCAREIKVWPMKGLGTRPTLVILSSSSLLWDLSLSTSMRAADRSDVMATPDVWRDGEKQGKGRGGLIMVY